MRRHIQQVVQWSGMLLSLGLALTFLGCGGDGDETPNIAGTYRGTVQDSVAGTGTIVTTIAQNDESLTGTFQTTFSNPANNNSGSVSGRINGSSVSLVVTPSNPTSCPFNVTANVNGATIQGTYAAFNCSRAVSGTLSLTRQ